VRSCLQRVCAKPSTRGPHSTFSRFVCLLSLYVSPYLISSPSPSHLLKEFKEQTNEEYQRENMERIFKAANEFRPTILVVSATFASQGVAVAEALKIPVVIAATIPMVPSEEIPPILFSTPFRFKWANKGFVFVKSERDVSRVPQKCLTDRLLAICYLLFEQSSLGSEQSRLVDIRATDQRLQEEQGTQATDALLPVADTHLVHVQRSRRAATERLSPNGSLHWVLVHPSLFIVRLRDCQTPTRRL